ncbi:MAG: D-inositol-3-phosphate glycosyltransferase [Microlunatus sp.]
MPETPTHPRQLSPIAYPRRVAMISVHTSPLATPGVGDAGGLNVYVAELAKRLGERGLGVDVFTRRTDHDTPEIVDINEHARVIQLTAGPVAEVAKEELPGYLDEFVAAMEPHVPDHQVLHSHYWLSGMVARTLRDRHRIPMVHTMHTMARVKNELRGDGHLTEPDIREQGEAAIVAGADILTANTTAEADELRRHYRARDEQIAVVPPGVDLHTFHPCDQPKSRAQLGVPQDAEVILFVGRIQPLKAPDVLIRAAGRLVAERPDRRERLRLIIIGSPSGPQSAWAQTLPELVRDLGLGDVVEFRPHSPRAELFRWYCVCDVVGVPSHNESFGLVALEAQACGRPVVATDVGGLRHAVEDGATGLLVPGHDPAEWAEALGAILDDRQAAGWLGAAGAVHAATFSWSNTAASTLRAYAAAQRGYARTQHR